jgi:hypothetical protein
MAETESKRYAPRVYNRAIVKFNNGLGALLCNRCYVIIATGRDHQDIEHYCDNCRRTTDAADPVHTRMSVRLRCSSAEL